MEIPVFWLVNQDKLFSTFILHIESKISQLNEFLHSFCFLIFTKMILNVPKNNSSYFKLSTFWIDSHWLVLMGFDVLNQPWIWPKFMVIFSFIEWYFKILAIFQFKTLILLTKFKRFELYICKIQWAKHRTGANTGKLAYFAMINQQESSSSNMMNISNSSSFFDKIHVWFRKLTWPLKKFESTVKQLLFHSKHEDECWVLWYDLTRMTWIPYSTANFPTSQPDSNPNVPTNAIFLRLYKWSVRLNWLV